MLEKTPSPRRFFAHAGMILAAATGLVAVYSCSLIVESKSQQCQMDSDCSGFAGFGKCDIPSGLCMSTTSTTSTGTGGSSSSGAVGCNVDGGIDGGGCYNGGASSCAAATTNSELLNQCTTGQCFPFDDSQVKGLMSNGQLPPLPAPPDGGL